MCLISMFQGSSWLKDQRDDRAGNAWIFLMAATCFTTTISDLKSFDEQHSSIATKPMEKFTSRKMNLCLCLIDAFASGFGPGLGCFSWTFLVCVFLCRSGLWLIYNALHAWCIGLAYYIFSPLHTAHTGRSLTFVHDEFKGGIECNGKRKRCWRWLGGWHPLLYVYSETRFHEMWWEWRSDTNGGKAVDMQSSGW